MMKDSASARNPKDNSEWVRRRRGGQVNLGEMLPIYFSQSKDTCSPILKSGLKAISSLPLLQPHKMVCLLLVLPTSQKVPCFHTDRDLINLVHGSLAL